VKLTPADRCLDAPHELIIEMFSYWHGLRWSFLRNRPNFVRNGIAADFAVHSNARLRWAALDDPEASPELIEALSHDPSSIVYPWAIRATAALPISAYAHAPPPPAAPAATFTLMPIEDRRGVWQRW
jgi:hypothetical protein